MTIIFFVFSLITFLFTSFTTTFRLQSINRTIMYMPVQIFETAINIVNIDETKGLYFDKQRLVANLENYFEENLPKYMKDYSYTLYYYNQKDQSICTKSKCDAVEVTVTGHYAYNFKYTRSVAYEIHKGAKYGQ